MILTFEMTVDCGYFVSACMKQVLLCYVCISVSAITVGMWWWWWEGGGGGGRGTKCLVESWGCPGGMLNRKIEGHCSFEGGG